MPRIRIPRGTNRVPGGERGPPQPRSGVGPLKRVKGGWNSTAFNSRGQRVSIFIPEKQSRVRKSVADLDTAIQKARGMLPRGGKFGPDRYNWMQPNGRRDKRGGFLMEVQEGGKAFHSTGKLGRNIKTGKRVMEYSRRYADKKGRRYEARTWADVRGRTYGD